ncbi:MAG: hypothetical protein WC273_09060 [Dehalococcoidia bacterium]
MAAVLRVIGPPGSGKTLLIVSLAEALRSRGHRVATVSPRRDGATLIVLSNSGRVTVEQPLGLERLRGAIPSMDPSVAIILAEGYDAPGDAAFPAIVLAPRGAAPAAGALAVVASEEIEATFARLGPGEMDSGATRGLVDLVEQRVLGVPPGEPPAAPPAPVRGWRAALRRFIVRQRRRSDP